MRRNPRFRALVLSLIVLLSAGAAAAQVVIVGELGGQVKDETGAALPGATVTATSVERGVTMTTTTDSTGRFRFGEIQPGRYDVTVALSGFATVTAKSNLVENQKKTDLPITLKLTAEKAEVTVTDDRKGINNFVVEVADLRQLQDIMTAIREVPDVMNVERVRGL